MPRPERPLDPAAGPIQAFAQQLRDLRRAAGMPKYLQMARATGRSRTSLAEAAGGDHLPTWDTVEAFVSACGGDPLVWRVTWEQVRDEVRPVDQVPADRGGPREVPDPPPQVPPDPVAPAQPAPVVTLAQPGPPHPHPYLRRVAQVVVGVAVGVLALAATYWAGLRDDHPAEGSRPVSSAAITVHNKVAIGASGVAEDSTPSYLSTKPVSMCAARGCKIAGTEVWTGAELVARCWTPGETMTNRDLTSEGIDLNPAGVTSDLWYEIVLHDGQAGYLSEVYIAPQHRDGMELPRCQGR